MFNPKFKKNANDVEQPVDRHLLFAVYDEKAATYGVPITHPTVNVAIRSFSAACQNPQSFLNQFAADYALYHIGTYDDASARIISFPEPRFIIRASELVSQLKQELKPSEVTHAPSDN